MYRKRTRVTEWRTRGGRKRRIRLYAAWVNMHSRVRGNIKTGNTDAPIWLGIEIQWKTFSDFREWALKNGYSRKRNSLDRLDPMIGYTESNCEWVTVEENSRRSYRTMIGYNDGSGPVPF